MSRAPLFATVLAALALACESMPVEDPVAGPTVPALVLQLSVDGGRTWFEEGEVSVARPESLSILWVRGDSRDVSHVYGTINGVPAGVIETVETRGGWTYCRFDLRLYRERYRLESGRNVVEVAFFLKGSRRPARARWEIVPPGNTTPEGWHARGRDEDRELRGVPVLPG